MTNEVHASEIIDMCESVQKYQRTVTAEYKADPDFKGGRVSDDAPLFLEMVKGDASKTADALRNWGAKVEVTNDKVIKVYHDFDGESSQHDLLKRFDEVQNVQFKISQPKLKGYAYEPGVSK